MPRLDRFGGLGRRGRALLPLAGAVFLGQSVAIPVTDASAQSPTPSAPPYVQQGEFSPEDGAFFDLFGTAVAMSSDGLTAAVTAPGLTAVDTINGAFLGGGLYIFTQKTGGIWTLVAEFKGPQFGNPGFGLGESVAVSGDGLTVATSVGLVDAGSAVRGVAVVRNVGGTWGIDATVMVPGALITQGFSSLPLALSNTGTTMVVGNAAQANVLVYERAGTWALSATLTASVKLGLGWAVAVSAAGDRILASNGVGDVEAFAGVGSAWSAGQVLFQGDAAPPDAFGAPTGAFGYAVALSADGRTAVVSDPFHNGGAGAVYVYLDHGGFIQEAELTSSAPAAGDLLGWSVAVDGTGATVVAGAPRAGDGTDQGEALEFTAPSAGWNGDANEDEVLVAGDASDYSYFGRAVAVSADSNYSLVGASRVLSDWVGVFLYGKATSGGTFYSFGPLQATTTALTIAPQPAIVNQPVTLSATVNSSSTPDGGDVTFQNAGTAIPGCTQIPIDTNTGIALCQTTLIALGTFPITALYSGDAGYDGSTSPTVALQVITQPVITGVVAPAAVNVFYATGFGGTGGTAPYTFSLAGTLPTGLSFFPAPSPLIEGKPTQANSVTNVTLTMTDSSVPPAIVNRPIEIVVSGATYPPLLIITTLPGGVTGAGYGIGFQALGGDSSAKIWSLANGTTLPPTLSLASNGNLSGRLPSTPGAVKFDVQVANQSGLTPPVVQSFTILVTPAIPPTPLVPGTPVATVVGAPGSSAIVTWTAPTNAADAAVTNYTVTSSPGGISVGTPSPIPPGGGSVPTSLVVRGLTPGVAYTFTVTASNNAQLTSAPSAPSNAIVAVATFAQHSAQSTSKSGATFASAATPSGSVTADAVGLGTVVVADYPDSPYATLPSAQSFVDVKTLAGSAFTSVTITICGGAAASGLEWWNATATAWQPVVPSPTMTGTCARFTVNATSTPNLAQLTGTPLALLTSPTIIAPPIAAGQLDPPGAPASISWATSVAVSGDGKTVLVGAPSASLIPKAIGTPGAPAVAVLSNTTGTWQVQSFIPSPALTNLSPGTVGLIYASGFGQQVVLSSDGSTALITAPEALGPGQGVRDNPQGATFVFHQTDGVWTLQAELSEPFAGTGLAYSGTNVGLSSDGTTAFITRPFADLVWIYTATNGVWSNQAILMPSDPQFIDPSNPEQHDEYGTAAAISADGNTLVVGAWLHKSLDPMFAGNISGAVYVYTRAGTTWTQKAELFPQAPDALSPGIQFGTHVAVSGDGTTVFATEPLYHGQATEHGAVAVFVSSDGWATSTQTALLVSPDVAEDVPDQFGLGLAVASGGQTLLVSDEGTMVWMFVADHGGWAAHGVLRPPNLMPNPAVPPYNPNFGSGGGGCDPISGGCGDFGGIAPIALSVDGSTLAVGALNSNNLFASDHDGFLYLYGIGSPPGEALPIVPQYATPTVTGVAPALGAAAGGTPVTITGTNFSLVSGATSFAFGAGNVATVVVCATSTSFTAVSPAGAGGTTVDVIATVGPSSSSAANPPGDQFSWTAVVLPDTTPPVVTPPASISIPATQAGGATGSASLALAAFFAGGSAVDNVDPSPLRLPPQAGGVSVDNTTLFPIGTTTVTFLFKDASGNIGLANSTVTVTLGTPRITGSVARVGTDQLSGATYVNVVLTNTGTGNARNLIIKSLTFRTLSGTGTVTYNSTLSQPLPITLGNLDVGAAVTIRVLLNVPSTATRISITENGPVQDVLGTSYNYSTAEALVP